MNLANDNEGSPPAAILGLLVLLALATAGQPAFSQGGGDLNPDLHTDPQALQKFLDLRVGLSVHWGPSAHTGFEISWSRGPHRSNLKQLVSPAEYDTLYKKFNPTRFDGEEWVRLIKRWGMRYLMPTGKHHDGFALWFSRYSDYDMENTPFRRDIMKELSQACRKHGVVFGSYYSNLDWYHPDWKPYEPEPGPLSKKHPDSPSLDRYLTYMRNQVTELIRDYGVEILQFDGEWPDTWTHEIGSKMYRDLRQVSSTVLISSRIDKERYSSKDPHTGGWNRKYAGDYHERERMVTWTTSPKDEIRHWAEDPWQAWVTIDREQWAWNPNPDLMTADEVILDLVRTVGNNGNYLINLGPRPDGTFHPDQVAIMDQVGAWLQENGEAIYGTRGGPFYPAAWGLSTRKGAQAYLHVIAWSSDSLQLPPLKQKIVSARLLGGPVVKFRQSEQHIAITVPEGSRQKPVTIVALEFDAPPEMATVK